jgi:hypothetical protein
MFLNQLLWWSRATNSVAFFECSRSDFSRLVVRVLLRCVAALEIRSRSGIIVAYGYYDSGEHIFSLAGQLEPALL